MLERTQSVDIYFFYCESLHKVHSKNSLHFFAIPASHATLAAALVDGGGAAATAGGGESCATLIFHPAAWPHTLCPQLKQHSFISEGQSASGRKLELSDPVRPRARLVGLSCRNKTVAPGMVVDGKRMGHFVGAKFVKLTRDRN